MEATQPNPILHACRSPHQSPDPQTQHANPEPAPQSARHNKAVRNRVSALPPQSCNPDGLDGPHPPQPTPSSAYSPEKQPPASRQHAVHEASSQNSQNS